MAAFEVDPSMQGAPVPHGAFSDDTWLYVRVPSKGSNVPPTLQAIPKKPEITNIQAFDSGTFGNPTAEDIWAFKANRLAYCAAGLAATTQNMQNTVQGLNRPDWEQRIAKLNAAMQEAYAEAKGLCDSVNTARSKPGHAAS